MQLYMNSGPLTTNIIDLLQCIQYGRKTDEPIGRLFCISGHALQNSKKTLKIIRKKTIGLDCESRWGSRLNGLECYLFYEGRFERKREPSQAFPLVRKGMGLHLVEIKVQQKWADRALPVGLDSWAFFMHGKWCVFGINTCRMKGTFVTMIVMHERMDEMDPHGGEEKHQQG